jgi:hypothetical protein
VHSLTFCDQNMGMKVLGLLRKIRLLWAILDILSYHWQRKNGFSKVINGLKGQAPYIEYCQC